jgi:site-specific recombinase
MPDTQRLPSPPNRRSWWQGPGEGHAPAALIEAMDAGASLPERHLSLIALLDWIRAGDRLARTQEVLALLADNASQRRKVVELLATCWQELDMAALLADHGFAARAAFLTELGERLRRRMLPASPDTTDLAALFELLFNDAADADWLRALDAPALKALGELWADALQRAQLLQSDHERRNAPLAWRQTVFDAMAYMASQVRATGFSPAFRSRMGVRLDADFDVNEADAPGANAPRSAQQRSRQAFRQLSPVLDRLHELTLAHAKAHDAHGHWPAEVLQEAQYLRLLLNECAQMAGGLHGHLEQYGVSVDLVFQIDQLQKRCRRIEQLLDIALADQAAPLLRELLAELVETGRARRGVRSLFSQHSSLLSRKVAERSAETGEHYITRNRAEYWDMLKRAGGGGAVLSVTTFMKFAIAALALSPFWAGMGAGLNYAVSFVIVQWLHLTVATKQPAMTAPAMAARLAHLKDDIAIEAFVDEVAHLVRSQMAGILGNVLVVAPLVLLAQIVSWHVAAQPLIGEAKAQSVLEHLTLLGPTAFYAAFTGVLLFASSILAGWAENWFVLNRLDGALQWNPRIRRWLGPERAARWSSWWRANISGLAANISLGFMLGVVPVLASFVALPLDVRHVTLSTGQVVAAAGTLGWQVLDMPAFWWCVAALPLTGLLNLGVSFLLALRVAMRAREVRVKDRTRLRRAIWRRLARQPLSFFWPPRDAS